MCPDPADRFTAQATETGKTCAICQTAIIRGEPVARCRECQLVYHEECWRENGGCAQYGCANAPEVGKEEAPALQSNVWGETKRCPECGREIKAIALKCRFCGAVFDTRDQLSATAYAQREYRDKEYAFARNVILGLFLMSITGCLSPVALILNLVLRHGGSLGAIQLSRLPDELKALQLIGLIISGFLVGLAVLMLLLQALSSL